MEQKITYIQSTEYQLLIQVLKIRFAAADLMLTFSG